MSQSLIAPAALIMAAGLITGAHAQVNLSAETATPDGVPGNTVMHLADVASEQGVANLQVAQGQTLTNSIRNVAEGKSDISAAPIILPFLPRDAMPFSEEQLTLVSEDNMLRSLGSAFAEVVNKEMSNEMAKALTKAHIDSIDKLKAHAAMLANVGLGEMDPVLSGFCGQSPLKYHPGAVQAWEEAGLRVPECAQAK